MSKIVPKLQELRIFMCPNGDSSKGVRQFIDKSYFALYKAHPGLPITVKERPNVEPHLQAQYDKGDPVKVPLAGMEPAQVKKEIEKLLKK